MIALWPWASRAAAALGLGVLPLSWAPVRRAPALVRPIGFAWGLLQILFSVWSDFRLLAAVVDSCVLNYNIARVFLLFLAVWWSHPGLFDLVSQLERLCGRYPEYDGPRNTRETGGCLLFLAVLNFASIEELFKATSSLKANGGYSLGLVIFTFMEKNLNLLVPALYIMLVDEFTNLFRKVEHLWKQELDSLLSGSLDSELQSLRIFHAEISSLISALKRALGVNMLLHFAFTFGDVLLAFFCHNCSGRDESHYSLAARVSVNTATILLVVRCTQRMVDASEDISSNLRDLKLSKLSTLDQMQVELLLQKLAFRPVRVDVCGMFTINKQLILEIIMGVTTCCNAMVQLKPYVIIKQSNSHITENTTALSESSTISNAS